ncbi:MAG: hypothetical protein KatS3mg115_0572 [Candidatus Poribacteria bacterium]|nr:MAG: hypothetical protein KatS3mg115_0572 [Candidatus Poribacteria bacterium]
MGSPEGFYLPEDPHYTVVDAARDSVRYVLERALTVYNGHHAAKSSFLDREGNVMGWHDFGHLEGPGWAANAVGGAWELERWGRLTRDARLLQVARSIVDHVLEDGFVDWRTGFIYPYRHTQEDRFCLNFKQNDEWFCPGSLAKVGYQLWGYAQLLGGPRARRMREAALNLTGWLTRHVRRCDNGWLPRRCAPDGSPYPFRAEGGSDPFFDRSADGLFLIQLLTEVGEALGRFHPWTLELAERFLESGGIFGSINHDTYDAHENVAYAVAFRVFRRLAEATGCEQYRSFAYEVCLRGLDRFKMAEDRNGVPTKGLLWMEESWNTAYLWENAEAALAYVEAYGETGAVSYLRDALTILRAMARVHDRETGFLTEGVDWDNVVGAQHHVDGAEFGPIRYTEPFLNHLHHLEPLCLYLERYAARRWSDAEGNPLLEVPAGTDGLSRR